VWQWCEDLYAPQGPARVVRGGSWLQFGQSCRAGNRDRFMPANQSYNLGFRLARVPRPCDSLAANNLTRG